MKASDGKSALGGYVVHKGNTDYLGSIRAEIIPDTAEDVDRSLVDDQGRYDPR
jgi:hypothetical protein